MLLAVLLSAAFAKPVVDEEVCVVAERERRDVAERPAAVGPRDGWRTLRASLEALLAPPAVSLGDVLAYLPWEDPAPGPGEPLAVRISASPHPDDPGRSLVRVGAVAARGVERAPLDLVVIVDVSASMDSKLGAGYPALHLGEVDFGRARWPWFQYPLASRHDVAKAALAQLVAELGPDDRLAVVNFGKGADVFVPPTPADPDGPLLERIANIGVPRSGDPDTALALALDTMSRMTRPCADWRFLVISDGGATLGGGIEDVLRVVSKTSATEGVTWSGITVGSGSLVAEELESVAWAGYGWHGYADNPYEAREVFRDTLRGVRVVGRDVAWTVDFGGAAATRLDDGPARGSELRAGDQWVELYEVAAPPASLSASVAWSVGSPVPGEWTRTGRVEAPAPPAAFESADADLRIAWVARELARLAPSGEADWERLFGWAEGARREGQGIDLELAALVARAAAVQAQTRSQGK